MRTVAVIQARMGSSRLPGKVLMQLGNRSVLQRVMERVSTASLVDEVMVATSVLPGDDGIWRECARLGVRCFRGSEQDVLARFHGAAEAAGADHVVRITGDCPLFDGSVLDSMLAKYRGTDPAADYMSNVAVRRFPRGLDAEVFSRAALHKAAAEAKEPHQREHVTPYFYENPGLFRLGSFEGTEDLSAHRWTLDTPEDWAFMERVHEALSGAFGDSYGTGEVLELLRRHPEIFRLNSGIQQHCPTPA